MSHGSVLTIGLGALASLLILSGCSKKPAPPYPQWYQTLPPAPRTASNAYFGYVEAASQAEQAAREDIFRVSFTGGQRQRVMKRLEGATKTLLSAVPKTCSMVDRAVKPDQAPAYQPGWRLLGRVLAWRVEAAVAAEDYEAATKLAASGCKFGYDLAGGNASDAALGFEIVDECRDALVPALPSMSPVDLTRVYDEFTKVLDGRPGPKPLLDNERLSMLAAVQFVQDAYQREDFQPLRKILGPDAREPIRYLEELKDRDGEERVQYFKKFAAEIGTELSALRMNMTVPVSARLALTSPPAEGRPWKRFARHFFRSARVVADLEPRVLARTRLLILNALVLRAIKETGKATLDRSNLPRGLATDPYSGRPFIFTAVGTEYKLYSLGVDLRDDGGETDEQGLVPDIVVSAP